MNKVIVPPEWDQYDEDMLVNVRDMRYYYENYTEITNEIAEENKLAVENLNGRVAKLEQEIPVGPGGTGAFLNLGGVPERYPTAEEMVAGGLETGFMVIARTDGIYFYNPSSKTLIKPKTGGGTMALHGQLPMIYDNSHKLQYNGRVNISGIYTATAGDVGLSTWTSHDMCKILVVVTETEEFHTAMGPDGYASRIFRPGVMSANWTHFTGSGGGGGNIDPAIIEEINDRLDALETHGHIDKITDLTDVIIDPVLDADGILYVDGAGKVRADGKVPALVNGSTPVHANSVGSAPVISSLNVNAVTVARNSVIILRGSNAKTVTLPNVVAFDTLKPATTEVREGRTTFLVNTSDADQTVQVPAGGMFYVEGNMDSTNGLIPPKTVFVYNPAIIDNGSGALMQCWVYMGNYPLRATDLSAVMADVQDLKNKHDEQVTQIEDLETAFDELRVGNFPVMWNNMKQKIAASSNNIGASDIAANAFTLGLGGTSNRSFTLPDIVDADTNPLPANSVREGRLTIISQQGGGYRDVILSAGCKFVSGGTVTDTNKVIPPGQAWILLPAVYGNGDKCWSIIGSFSSHDGHVDQANGYSRTSTRSVTGQTMFSSNQINQSGTINACVLGNMSTGAVRFTLLPEIIPYTNTSGFLQNHQVREGKIFTIATRGTFSTRIRPHAGQFRSVGGVDLSADYDLLPGIMETYLAIVEAGVGKWLLIGKCKDDGSPVGFSELTDRVIALENAPAPTGKEKFIELDDTPSGYQPGKLIGYNLAGDALIPVDPVDTLKKLSDTPNDYGGHARKYLAVKPSEDGIDFVTGPDVSGLTTDVNNLHNDMISVTNTQTVHGQKITALETEVPAIQADVTTLETSVGTLTTTQTAHGNRITALEGDTTVSSNDVLYNPLIGTGNYTQANAVTFNPCILRSTTSRSLELPAIVAANATPTTSQSKVGRMLMICNHSAAVNLTVNGGTGRLIRYPNTTTAASHVLAAGQCMEVMAMISSNVGYWQVIRQWTV